MCAKSKTIVSGELSNLKLNRQFQLDKRIYADTLVKTLQWNHVREMKPSVQQVVRKRGRKLKDKRKNRFNDVAADELRSTLKDLYSTVDGVETTVIWMRCN